MPPPRKTRRIHSPWSDITIQTQWSVAGTRAALTEHEQGQFAQSGKLIDMLGRDARIGHPKAGVLGTRANALLGSPFRLKPADEDNERAVQIATEMEEHWWTVLPEATTRELLRYYWLGGGAPGQLRWTLREGRWLPIVQSWQLLHLYHEESSDDDGQLSGRLMILTRDGNVELTAGDGKWLLIADGDRWWLNGSVRSVSIPWLGKQFAFRDSLRHSERLGHPIIKAMYPAQADADEIDLWFEDLKALAAETTARLPQNVDGQDVGFDLDLLEAAQDSPEAFHKLIAHVDTLYAVHLLGHNLAAEVKEGQAVTGDSQEVRDDYKMADNQTLSTQLREQLCIPWAAEWYPDGEELAPWPWWDVEPPEDTQAKAETQKTAGEALTALQKAGYEPRDIDAWSEQYGLELVEIEKPEPVVPPPPPGQPPPDDDDSDGDDGDDDSEEQLADKVKQDGFFAGQEYVDELADSGVAHGRTAMAPDLRAVLAAADGGETPAEVRERLLAAFGDMSPGRLAEWLERAVILAELKGQESVLGDL
jgi:phage gp29-like protein